MDFRRFLFLKNLGANESQRQQDDNINKYSVFEGGIGGAERNFVQKRSFRGKRHDN